MLRKILGALGMGAGSSSGAPQRGMRIQPYREEHCNFFYNLLFCDDRSLFAGSAEEPWPTLLGERPDPAALRAIADDEAHDSRTRMLAFNRLRELGEPVPPKLLLGTIVEVPLEGGLDTLAAFTDGGVRYINHSGKMSVFEGTEHPVHPQAEALLAASRSVVRELGPWVEPRLPPPSAGSIRMSFLVSDGLYFGQGPYAFMLHDARGGPIVAASQDLLTAVVAASVP